MYTVREVRESDLPYLAERLRAADVLELLFASGSPDTLGSLRMSVEGSAVARVGCWGDSPFLVWGMSASFGSSALVWAVATPEVTRHHREFLRKSREAVKGLFDAAPEVKHLINFTHADNHVHHRWLSWCGAKLLPAVQFGPLGGRFRPFSIQREFYHV